MGSESPCYALYLAPCLTGSPPTTTPCPGTQPLLAAAAQHNHQWGGLHVTLAGFAHPAEEDGASVRHGVPLTAAMQDVLRAAAAARQSGSNAASKPSAAPDNATSSGHAATWPCQRATWVTTPDGVLIIKFNDQDPVLQAIAQAVARNCLHAPRATGRLHMTLGPWQELAAAVASSSASYVLPQPGSPAEGLPDELAQHLGSVPWELVVAKSLHLDPLQVVEWSTRVAIVSDFP